MKKLLGLLLLASACTNNMPESSAPAADHRPNTFRSEAIAAAPTAGKVDEPEAPQARLDEEGEPAEPAGDDSAYAVVEERDHNAFTKEVNRHLENGYHLRGAMRTERTGPSTFVYLQALVRHRADK
jgi:hypothetical protein